MRDKRATAKETQALYSSGLRLTRTSIKLLAAVTTPYTQKCLNFRSHSSKKINKSSHTRCWSFNK
jgi:hypothetical protein